MYVVSVRWLSGCQNGETQKEEGSREYSGMRSHNRSCAYILATFILLLAQHSISSLCAQKDRVRLF